MRTGDCPSWRPILSAAGCRVIVVLQSLPATFAAKAVTASIPIVFSNGVDPVQVGLVSSLNRPGGNITGLHTMGADLDKKKRLGLLHDLFPRTLWPARALAGSNSQRIIGVRPKL
jgi:putative ABC transport system substrate-binding protein